MNDWNHSGKHDFGDSYIDYQIYKDVMSDDNSSSGQNRRYNRKKYAKTTDGKYVEGEDLSCS